MAPRGGRGGSSSSSSGGGVSTCPGAFSTTLEQASFALDVVFLVVSLGFLIALFSLRKKGVAGKKLLGLPFIGAVFFLTLSNACSIVATVLQQCNATDIYSYYNWYVAIVIFSYLFYWLLFVVVVFTLNSMLQTELNHSKSIFKTLLLLIVGLMGLLSVALASITAYINYESPRSDFYYEDYGDLRTVIDASVKLRAAYYALYLVSLLASGGLALATLLSLRKERKAGSGLVGWVIVLIAAMLLWVIIILINSSWYLNGIGISPETSLILSYVLSFGQALACIVILCIAKHSSWRVPGNIEPLAGTATYTPVAHPQQYAYNADTNNQMYQPTAPYAYNGNPNGPTYQYNQASELGDTQHPIR